MASPTKRELEDRVAELEGRIAALEAALRLAQERTADQQAAAEHYRNEADSAHAQQLAWFARLVADMTDMRLRAGHDPFDVACSASEFLAAYTRVICDGAYPLEDENAPIRALLRDRDRRGDSACSTPARPG